MRRLVIIMMFLSLLVIAACGQGANSSLTDQVDGPGDEVSMLSPTDMSDRVTAEKLEAEKALSVGNSILVDNVEEESLADNVEEESLAEGEERELNTGQEKLLEASGEKKILEENLPEESTGEIPILLYHSIQVLDPSAVANNAILSVQSFSEDLAYMRDNGYTTISLQDYLAYQVDKTYNLPDKAVVISFDDGYKDNYLVAYPLLKEYNSKATIFLIGWAVGRDKHVKNENPMIPYLSWEDAKEMMTSGLVEFGSHTYDLHSWAGLSAGYDLPCGHGVGQIAGETNQDYRDRLRNDFAKSKSIMEENLGVENYALAYPYGAHSNLAIETLKELGYKLAFVTDRAYLGKYPYEIRRYSVTEKQRARDILEKIY